MSFLCCFVISFFVLCLIHHLLYNILPPFKIQSIFFSLLSSKKSSSHSLLAYLRLRNIFSIFFYLLSSPLIRYLLTSTNFVFPICSFWNVVTGGTTSSSASVIPGGGFPPQNTAGQRICRQCGVPGRYKDGKCVEKWGPGPEGPGTVCDRSVSGFLTSYLCSKLY